MGRFYDYMPCDMGDLLILVCYVTSPNHIFKGLQNFTDGSLSCYVTTVASNGGHRHRGSGEINIPENTVIYGNLIANATYRIVTVYARLLPPLLRLRVT